MKKIKREYKLGQEIFCIVNAWNDGDGPYRMIYWGKVVGILGDESGIKKYAIETTVQLITDEETFEVKGEDLFCEGVGAYQKLREIYEEAKKKSKKGKGKK